jgi:hypothetical protein
MFYYFNIVVCVGLLCYVYLFYLVIWVGLDLSILSFDSNGSTSVGLLGSIFY